MNYETIIGKNVKLKHAPDQGSAKVKGKIFEADGGLILDRKLDGCQYWNIDDVKRGKAQ